MVIELIPGLTPYGNDNLTAIKVIGTDSIWIVPDEKRKRQLIRKFPGLRDKIKTYEEAHVKDDRHDFKIMD